MGSEEDVEEVEQRSGAKRVSELEDTNRSKRTILLVPSKDERRWLAEGDAAHV